ncbi:L-type lectin-like domain-containing protein [Ceratobasidium theobromae]|uniref:L-type lectin-like domain-containing protein n=1 Tax=Ceratobasidium theobromae TaxID=1582974 RepID=A0A5N5QPX4_9AGAM|nr:L-type lectin-like domain-containing protein [Ceratobasidium theobromae]
MWTRLNLVANILLLAAAGSNAQQKPQRNHTIDQPMWTKTCKIGGWYGQRPEKPTNQPTDSFRWFSFGGNAYVVSPSTPLSTVITPHPQNTNKHIRLTRDKPSQVGWLWSRLPLTASHYQIIVEFKVSGGSSHLYGDGIAMWLTNTRAEPGPVFGSIVVRVDQQLYRYANSRHAYSFPRVMAMLGDGKTSYDVANDGSKNELAACSANIRKSDIATKLKLTYFKGEYLNLQLQYKGWDEWTECFSVWDVTLPSTPYLGFSAITGDVSDAHDIISISTMSAILGDLPATVPTRKTAASGGVWNFMSVLLKLAAVGLVCVAGLAGWRAYSRTTKRRTSGLGGGMPHWDNKRF